MHRKYLFGLIPLLLCSCGGPLSLVSYTLASGVAMNAKQEEYEAGQRDLYSNKCLPTHRKENPISSGNLLEASGNLVRAYEYYTIAHQLGYKEAGNALMRLTPKMSVENRKEADKNLAKYKELHIKTCFIPAPRT